jgi:hypothetical protein
MNLSRISLTTAFVLSVLFVSAQINTTDSVNITDDIFSALQNNTYGGNITILQEPSLHVLIDRSIRINKKKGLNGYRIQIFSGSGNNAREQANKVAQEFKSYFPNFDHDLIYFNYQAPYFKVRIGDFRNRNEAFELYNKIIKKFPSSYIVKSRIKFPKLKPSLSE